MTAYDYDKQVWVEGIAAIPIRRAQIEQELAAMTGLKARQYCGNVGYPYPPIALLARLKAELAGLDWACIEGGHESTGSK